MLAACSEDRPDGDSGTGPANSTQDSRPAPTNKANEPQGLLSPAGLPPTNPYLMENSFYPVVHFNAGATDASPFPNWEGDVTISAEDVRGA
jgi:hypothetical protein